MKVSFDTDRERALRGHPALGGAGADARGEDRRSRTRCEMERLADALPIERAASRWIVSTDPDEQVERIAPYIDLGFRHLVFHAPGPDQERFLRLYARAGPAAAARAVRVTRCIAAAQACHCHASSCLPLGLPMVQRRRRPRRR